MNPTHPAPNVQPDADRQHHCVGRLPIVLASAVLLTAAGCSYKYDQDFFDYDREQSRARRVFEAHYAKAAADESALYPSHFDEADHGKYVLNGLGRERIDYMLSAREPGVKLTVKVDVGDATDLGIGDRMADAAEAYLRASGMTSDLYAMKIGETSVQTDARESLAGLSPGSDGVAGGSTSGMFGN